jgi:hypothetical protein
MHRPSNTISAPKCAAHSLIHINKHIILIIYISTTSIYPYKYSLGSLYNMLADGVAVR